MVKFIFCLLLSIHAHAEIKEVSHMKEIEQLLNAPIAPSEWIMFDIDYTLTQPETPVLQMAVIKQNKIRFKDELATFPEKQKALIPILMVTYAPSVLTDLDAPSLISKLQEKGILVLGFTAADTSQIPNVGSIPSWRKNELKRLGIDFSPTSKTSSIAKESIEFRQFSSFRGTYPLYKEGILYCNVTASKGDLLTAFIDKQRHKPSKIVFIDDTIENLESVEAALKKLGIAFVGIHYSTQAKGKDVPMVTDQEWNSVWNAIRKRAEAITQVTSLEMNNGYTC
jgi:hypothetical protein